MSTHEDVLRDVLRSSAEKVVPAGDGLARIQSRLARRRRLRWTLLPGAALVAAGATVAVLALGASAPRDTVTQLPGQSGPGTLPPTPSVGPAPTAQSFKGVPHGPVLSEYSSADMADVIRQWLSDVGVDAQPLPQTCGDCAEVPLGAGDAVVGIAHLVNTGAVDGVRQWALAAVTNQDLTITAPAAGAAVATSFEVTGTVAGYHQSVSLALVTPEVIGTAQTMAGQDQPWRATMTWQHREWTTASLVARTYSDKDGSLSKLVALPVRQGS